MKTAFVTAISIAALVACATPSTMFVSPDGKVTRCAAHGWGYVGAPMAQGIHDSCTADAKAAGQIPMTEAGSIGVMPSTEVSSMRILKVVPGSPADLGGIKAGDSIIAVDDQPVTNWADARRLIFGRKGTSVKVTYRSGGVDKTANLVRYAVTNMQQ
jgi:membrane-associated protease RseP (regulator of RpoE activity)